MREDNPLIRFGPAGNSDRFYREGRKASEQAPAWLADLGLNAYEYSAGHGVSLGESTGRRIGEAAARTGIRVSLHAPYYINCCQDAPGRAQKNIDYLLAAAAAVDWMGGDRVVFHVGTPGKLPRAEAFSRAAAVLAQARRALDGAGLGHVLLCPETMGRPSQLGTLDEVIALCRADERMVPTLDFGHLHAAGGGALRSPAAFERVLTALIDGLGTERSRAFHAHFSRIEYTAKGERRHMTFADQGYGPDFAHLAPLLVKHRMEPTIICESRGTQADDAIAMRDLYAAALRR
ncbi:MAG: TIM barrel protein [Clostridiales bacterium]|nr:TIM barrel protein [Clostridiales bacterium]